MNELQELLPANENDSRRRRRTLLSQHILEGDTRSALGMVHLFSNEELRSERIGGKWALHCLPRKAFENIDQIRHTQELILKSIEAGWDVNVETGEKMTLSSGGSPLVWWCIHYRGAEMVGNTVTLSNFTLLHVACCYESHDIINLLVERGADVNKLTGANGGNVVLSPLHISAICREWESASLLVENGSNPNSEGFVNIPGFHFSRVIRSAEDENGEGAGTHGFTAIELVLLRGWRSEASRALLLESMLQGRERTTVAEFHVAMEGGSPFLASTILKRLPPEDITMEELQWVTLRSEEGGVDTKLVPSFSFFVDNYDDFNIDTYALRAAADLLGALVDRGYNCNLGEEGLIFKIIDMVDDENIILNKLLQLDHVSLHVRNGDGKTPVECALPGPVWGWDSECVDCCKAGRYDYGFPAINHFWTGETVILLVQHGADVSNLVIRPNFFYHKVHEELFKVLYSAGAKIDQEYLQNEGLSSICECEDEEHKAKHTADLGELREWIREKDQVDKLSLKFKARIAVRKLLTSVGHLRLLDRRLPPVVKDEVLCKKIE